MNKNIITILIFIITCTIISIVISGVFYAAGLGWFSAKKQLLSGLVLEMNTTIPRIPAENPGGIDYDPKDAD